MSIFKPEFNVPATIALKFPDGMPVDSQFGKPQVLYTLWNDDRYYADLQASEAIKAAGIKPLQEFTIVKRQTQDGRKKGVGYEISFPGQGGITLPAQIAGSSGNTNGHQALQHVNGSNGHHNGNGNGSVPQVPTQLGYKQAMTNCLIIAIESAHAAEGHAMTRGYSVRIPDNALQDIASTLFIQAARQNFLTWNGGID